MQIYFSASCISSSVELCHLWFHIKEKGDHDSRQSSDHYGCHQDIIIWNHAFKSAWMRFDAKGTSDKPQYTRKLITRINWSCKIRWRRINNNNRQNLGRISCSANWGEEKEQMKWMSWKQLSLSVLLLLIPLKFWLISIKLVYSWHLSFSSHSSLSLFRFFIIDPKSSDSLFMSCFYTCSSCFLFNE